MTKADKEGQRKAPILRFKGFTNDWEQRQLREISSSTIGGGTPKSSNKKFWNGNIPWIQSSDLVNGDIWNITIKKHITLDAVENSAAKIISANSIAVVTRVAVGKLVYMPLEYATSQDFISFQNLSGDHSFFMYLVSKVMHKVRGSLQGTSIKGISKGELLKKKVIYTLNIKEQKKIGTLLKSLDTILTLYERKKELLKKFQQGFSDILFKKNPKECVSLGDYFYFNKGKNIGNKDLINNGKYYAIVYGELYTTYNYVISKVFSKTSIKGFKGRKNDLLFPSSSTVPFGTATCSALEIDNIELGNDIIVARPKNTNELDSAFISYQINSKRKILYPIISGTTITHMYSKDLSKIRIWLPNITTQNYISNILQRISHLNILVDKKVNILKEIKKEFLNTMFI